MELRQLQALTLFLDAINLFEVKTYGIYFRGCWYTWELLLKLPRAGRNV